MWPLGNYNNTTAYITATLTVNWRVNELSPAAAAAAAASDVTSRVAASLDDAR